MFNFSLSNYAPSMALVMTLIASFAALGPVPAQPTPALIEDWRASDFNYASSMMDTDQSDHCLLYTSPSPRDRTRSRMPSSA